MFDRMHGTLRIYLDRILSRGDRLTALSKEICSSWQESAKIYSDYHRKDSTDVRLYFDQDGVYIPGITEIYGCYEMTLSMPFFIFGASSVLERNWTDVSLGTDAGCAILSSGAKKMMLPATAALVYLSYCWARSE